MSSAAPCVARKRPSSPVSRTPSSSSGSTARTSTSSTGVVHSTRRAPPWVLLRILTGNEPSALAAQKAVAGSAGCGAKAPAIGAGTADASTSAGFRVE